MCADIAVKYGSIIVILHRPLSPVDYYDFIGVLKNTIICIKEIQAYIHTL